MTVSQLFSGPAVTVVVDPAIPSSLVKEATHAHLIFKLKLPSNLCDTKLFYAEIITVTG